MEEGLLATPRLTPEQLSGWDLPRVMRGYDVQVVDEMRSAAVEEIRTLLTERDELVQELQEAARLAPAVPAHGAHAAPPGAAEVGPQAVRVLQHAQAQGEQIVGEAQEFARQVGEDGQRQRRQLVESARLQADALIRETRQKAEAMMRDQLADAHQRAADILARAPAEAQHRLTVVRALGTAWEVHLRTMVATVTDSLDSMDKSLEMALSDPGPAPALPGPADPGQG
jgi:cell division septum initiation protein DivIVA